LVLDGLDLIKTKGYFCSNLDGPSKIQRSGLLLPYLADETKEVAPWPTARELGLALRCTNLRSNTSYAI
jgi:hypothetical protein